jgi:hypothetical protein
MRSKPGERREHDRSSQRAADDQPADKIPAAHGRQAPIRAQRRGLRADELAAEILMNVNAHDLFLAVLDY